MRRQRFEYSRSCNKPPRRAGGRHGRGNPPTRPIDSCAARGALSQDSQTHPATIRVLAADALQALSLLGRSSMDRHAHVVRGVASPGWGHDVAAFWAPERHILLSHARNVRLGPLRHQARRSSVNVRRHPAERYVDPTVGGCPQRCHLGDPAPFGALRFSYSHNMLGICHRPRLGKKRPSSSTLR